MYEPCSIYIYAGSCTNIHMLHTFRDMSRTDFMYNADGEAEAGLPPVGDAIRSMVLHIKCSDVTGGNCPVMLL